MNTPNTDTETIIQDYAREVSAEIESALGESATDETRQEWEEGILDLIVLRSDRSLGAWKAEILLTCGGPHVEIRLDSRYSRADLFHSWGVDANTGEGRREWELSEEATNLLLDWIEGAM